ncbi:DUF945 domain-containing protein [Yokenella regensburgei]|jgi:hypothetical protein|uniref:DUF932 domain-containing protein n=1 Tax=Tenebrionicola larvae TaxID=2815733 RepID=A0A949Q325_9ENTR|nr:DUF932 domain-containing protein [Tenebrionicola larvae]CZY46955.1 protein of uncharacterised function DUF932 [Enterobacter hormaechei]
MTRLASRFGAANLIRRDRPLTREELFRVVPSVFSDDKYESRSERYTYIPTISLLDSLQQEGFQPFFACQTRVRSGRRETDHQLQLQKDGCGRQVPKEDYRATSDEGMSRVYLLINNEKYSLENEILLPGEVVPAQVAFEALKHTGAKDKLAFTALQSGESKPFSARGLHDALKDITWQDCLDQP